MRHFDLNTTSTQQQKNMIPARLSYIIASYLVSEETEGLAEARGDGWCEFQALKLNCFLLLCFPQAAF